MSKRKIFVLIPVFNEEDVEARARHIRDFMVQQCPEYEIFILVVDDGSENRVNLARWHFDGMNGLSTLRHVTNQGLGAALSTGFSALAPILRPDDLIVTLEGDGTANLYDLVVAVERFSLKRRTPDLVLLSVYAHGGGFIGLRKYRLYLSMFASSLSRKILDIKGIWTLTSLNRIYSGSVVLNLWSKYGDTIVKSEGFEANLELLIKICQLGSEVQEVSTVVDQSKRVGKSKMKLLKTVFRYLRIYFRREKYYN